MWLRDNLIVFLSSQFIENQMKEDIGYLKAHNESMQTSLDGLVVSVGTLAHVGEAVINSSQETLL